ncbi:hypothetical protein PENTCL1PPCAC_425, partial [Pristionchus entomophagus]
MLVNVGLMNDILAKRVRNIDVKMEVHEGPEPSTREYKKEFLPAICRQVLISICEQVWHHKRRRIAFDDEDMVAFTHERLRANGLGQQLLRFGTRRRYERALLAELSVCAGNWKKALIDKLLASLNIWNFHATMADLTLMIKEEASSKPMSQQQSAIQAEALMGEIAKCCRELFLQAHKRDEIIMKKDERFTFTALSNLIFI